MNSSFNSPSTKVLYRGTQIVWYLLGLIEVLLAFRFVLKLLGANPVGFTNFIYSVTYPLATPFSRVFGITYTFGNSIEWTTLLAMFVYWVIAFGVVNLLVMGKTISTSEAAVKMNQKEE